MTTENNVAAQAGEEPGWVYGRADAGTAVLKWAVVLEQAQKCGGREARNKLSFPTFEGKQQFDTWYAANTPISLRMRSVFEPTAAQSGDEPMRAARSIGTDRAFEAAAKALHLAWTPEGVHALIAAADAFVAAQVSPRATADVEREMSDEEIHAVLDALPISYWDVPQDATVMFARAILATTKPGA